MPAERSTFSLHVAAVPESLDAIHDLIDRVFTIHSADDDLRIRLESAIGEIAANIIEHGARGTSPELSITVFVSPEEVVAELTDNGMAADIDLSTASMPDESDERGRGLAITAALVDSLEYARNDDRNVWRLSITRRR